MEALRQEKKTDVWQTFRTQPNRSDRQNPGLEVCDSFLIEKFESLGLVSKFRVDWVADSEM